MKTLFLVLAIVACTFVQQGCGEDNILQVRPSCDCEVGDTVAVELGDTYTISLLAAFTAGYKWEFEIGFDERYVELESYEILDPNPESDLVGKPMCQEWTYRARKEGTVCATLIYTRAWEEESMKTRGIIVIIE
jgi:predicted secreted protein